MQDYNKQATDFLEAIQATIEARHLKRAPYFSDEKEIRDVWEVKITRGTREFVFTFGGSISDREKWDAETIKRIGAYSYNYMPEHLEALKIKARNDQNTFAPAGNGHRPDAYSILACLQKYEPADNVDEFASEFGITKPSEALRTYEAVKNEYQNIRLLFTDKEIEALQEIA